MMTFRSIAIGGALIVCATMSAGAQPMPYGPPITIEPAKKAMAAAEAEAKKNGWAVVIMIVDWGGHLVMMQRLDNTPYGALRYSEDKARTAVASKAPQEAGGGSLLVADGKIIGAIGVSGVTSEQDAQIAIVGAKAVR